MAQRPKAEITDPGYNSLITDENPSKPKILKSLRKETPDYVESLLQAIDTTVTTRIQQAQLDKTVLCTILESDWTNVEAGEYYVSEGDAKYLVKGEENAYRTGERVWVLIPCGDYNNQKTIISRQVGDVGDSFVYISPLENFVRLTEDIVPNTSKGRYSLKTNDFTKVYKLDDEGKATSEVIDVDKNDSILIASIDMTKASAVDIGGFSAFGISAKFKTDVTGLEIMRGNYGLHLVVTSVKEEIVGTINGAQKSEHDEAVDHLYLQCDDMWGNPYGYDMFFEQSKMFEINDPGRTKIKKIDVYFFQTYDEHDERGIVSNVDAMQSGKFVDINQRDIDPAPLEDNLFMQELSIYFGHTADNLNTGAYLYSQNSPNFIIKDGNPEDINDKTLVAKFIHTDRAGKHYVLNSLGNNSIYQQLLDTGSIPDEFTVRWYAYNPLSTENDLRAGSGWEDITDKGSAGKVVQINKYGEYELIGKPGAAYTDTNRTYRLNDADAGYEKFKVAYILFDSGLDGKTAPTEEDVASAKAAINDTDNTYTQTEKEAAQQVLDNYDAFSKEQRYWSIDLTFRNGDDQTWGSLDALNSLRLEFDDNGYDGNYLIYNTAVSGQAKMLNSSDAHVKRKLIGYFKSYITGETDLTRNTIRWYIPKSNTMISEPDWKDELFTGYKFEPQEGTYTYVNQNPALRWEPLNGKKATYNTTDKAWVLGNPGARPSTDMDSVATWDKYYIFESVIDTSKTSGLQDLKDGKVTIQYRIKEYWNQHFTNNTIMCKIIRDGKLYEKSADLRFGAHGVNGTEYSLIVELGDEYTADGKLVAEKVPAWTWTHPLDNYIVLNAQLYDERNQAITENITYTWKIEDFKNSGKLHPVIADNGNALRVLDNTESSNLFKLQNGNRLTRQGDYVDYRYLAGAYLKCTATHKGNQYTQYLLVPMRRNEQYVGCVGATAVTYTYANTAPTVSSKDAYQVLDIDYDLCAPSRTFSIYESSYIKNLEHVGNDNVKKIYSDLPYLSNIKKLNSTEPATLVLPPTYYQDMQYKMAVKMEVGGQLVWVQPILITLDVFTNSFLNQWDGSLQIDNKNNRIATAAVFSGKKNADNSFTGVIMGELQGETANATETGYGIYGRNNGNHTFGINTNGTAYLGDTSHAQLLFKVGADETTNTGWRSTIENKGYTDGSKKGMRLDFLGNTARYGKSVNMSAPYIDIININDKEPDEDDSARVADNTLNRVTISGNQDHLLEAYAHGKQVLHIGNGSYYLRTADYNRDGVNSTGTILNLKTGEFLSFGQKDNTTDETSNHALLISNKGVYPGWKVNGHSATDTDPNASSNQGGWVLYSHGNFGVDTTGKLFATGGDFAGKIVSTEGEIGGWTITEHTLRSGATNSTSDGAVTIANADFSRSINGTSRTELRLAIGGKFAVKKDGTLYASGGHFSGTISGGSITIGDRFSVDSDGNLTASHAKLTSATVSGAITATSGSFTGTIYASGGSLGNVEIKGTCSTSGLIVDGSNFSKQSGSIYYVNSITPTWDSATYVTSVHLSSSSGTPVSISVMNGGNYVGTATIYYSYNTDKLRAITGVNPSRYHYTFSYLGTAPGNDSLHD